MRTFLSAFWALLLLVSLCGHLPQAEAAEPAAALATMESSLASDPDNLRLGSEYRQSIIAAGEYDRCLQFFEKLVADHPNSAHARLNFGFAYVDKIPAAGSITQVILANNALTQFSKSLELQPSWLGYYTRGNSYLFWPKIFGRTPLAIADLEDAMKIQKKEAKRVYHGRTFIALGDGYWKMDDLAKARAVWAEGLAQFPDHAALRARLSSTDEELKALIEDSYDVNKRVDTSLVELWAAPPRESK